MPGGETRTHPEAASANSSFSRDIWEQLGGYRAERFAGDSEICWRARAQGHEIRFDPRAVVTHMHPISCRGLFRDRFTRGRDFGFTRSENCNWPRLKCLAYIAAAPVIPLAMTLRAGGHAAQSRRLAEWAFHAPFQLLFHSVWCAGEWTALLSRVAGGGTTTR
jgi:GT2 family glycosyltransferase